MKTKIRGTDIICTKNKGTNKINFIGMWCEANKIIIKTCKCLFSLVNNFVNFFVNVFRKPFRKQFRKCLYSLVNNFVNF